MQRTSPTSVLFTSYNLLNLFAGDSAEARQHYEMITGVIRALGSDVLAVDLNQDGATDIVTATRFGTFIYWGKPHSAGANEKHARAQP